MFPDWASWLELVLTAVAVVGILPLALSRYREWRAPYYIEFKQLAYRQGNPIWVRVDIWNRTSSGAYLSVSADLTETAGWSISREPPLWTVNRWPSGETYRRQNGIPPGQHESLRVEFPYGFGEFERMGLRLSEPSHPELIFSFSVATPNSSDGPAVPVTSRKARAFAKADRRARD